MKKWFPIIGLEIHAQLNTSSKLFSKAGKNFLAPTNSCVSNLDASMPGSLPVCCLLVDYTVFRVGAYDIYI